MAATFGHAFVGMAIARRFGVRSRACLAAAAIAGNLPDFDIPISYLLHGDGWKAHRTWTHTAGFALTAGALAGLAGLVRAESVEGERDLIADTLMGVAIVGSHLILDAFPYLPEVPFGPSTGGLRWANWALDALQWGAVAWLIWPKDQRQAVEPAHHR